METLELIEEYFKGEMSQDERQRFEEDVRRDPALANEVAFYISTGMAAAELVGEERRERFRILEEGRQPSIGKVVSMKRLWWAAAAAVVLLVSVYLGTGNPSANTLADNYIDKNYSKIDASMGVSEDLTQKGIASYNNNDFKTALVHFEQALQQNPSANKALEYAGMSALQLKNYETALKHFRQLSGITGLYENRGPFLQATTLLIRNESNDKENATRLLKEVVSANLFGSEEAKQWLKHLE
jgi:tetratricopeptide (TPR) repeat protein